jgi:Zn-dependent peptidase ImmA (M78 family)/transcriptional regulator with XRE-family HTH domain
MSAVRANNANKKAAPALPERLRLAREEAGLTQQQVADWLGIRRPGVVEFESGRRALKSDELAKLAVLYGRSLSWLARGEAAARDLVAAALFRAGDAVDPLLRRQAAIMARRCHLLTRIEAQLPHARGAQAQLPRYGDEEVLAERTRAYEHGRAVAYQERNRLGLGSSSPLRDPWGIVEGAGLTVLPLQLGRDHNVDGIFTRLRNGRACVGVNVDKWVFRQVFTVVHEYAHALMDGELDSEVCDTARGWRHDGRHRYANRELRANQFAAVFLVPREALLNYLQTRGMLRASSFREHHATGLTPIELVRAQDHFGASGDMLLWRLQNESFINATERRTLKDELSRHGVLKLARALGYDWRDRAQPFTRAHELALSGYAKGLIGLGGVADIFGLDKEEMHARLRAWEVHQELGGDDALVGDPG